MSPGKMELPKEPKNTQFNINLDQLKEVDSKGRDKKRIMDECGLMNESLLSFDPVKKKWNISDMSADKWKKSMNKLYQKDSNDFLYGRQ